MRPVPEPIEELNKQFWAYCGEEKLCFQRCRTCGKWRHLPRPMCAQCQSLDWQWDESSGRGKVYSWTVTRAPFHPAFADFVPYVVLVVEMDEGIRLVAGMKGQTVDDLQLGMAVEVVFERLSETVALPIFQPLE